MYLATIDDAGNLFLVQVDDAGEVVIRPPEGTDPGDDTARRDETCWGLTPWGPSDPARKQSRAVEQLHAHGWRTVGDWESIDATSATVEVQRR